MQPELQPDSARTNVNASTICPNCRSEMPLEMRFCRQCGFRLGEGTAEYTETVRFQTPHAAPRLAQAADSARATAASGPNDWGAMAQSANRQPVNTPQADVSCWTNGRRRRRKRMRWIVWPIIAIAIATASGGVIKTIKDEASRPTINQPDIEGSYIGADDFEARDGGVALGFVTPPGSAADKAGLVGGDVITSFDGKAVTQDVGKYMELLGSTPAGKTVEVVFKRDGETKTTKMTTISEDENSRLDEAFENRPEGKGYIGEGTELERVLVPGTKIYGVRIDEIRKNRPGEIAGLRNGDIVIEFDGVPVRTRREFESRIQRAMPGSVVKIIVMRGGERVEVPVKIGQEDND